MPSWRPPEQGEDGSQIFLIGDDLLKTKAAERKGSVESEPSESEEYQSEKKLKSFNLCLGNQTE